MRSRIADANAVEYLPAGLVLIESEVQPVAQVHAGRRGPEPISTSNARPGRVDGQRVRIPGIIFDGVPKKRGDVAGHGVAQTHDPGVLRWINQLVDQCWLKATEQADVGRGGHERSFTARAAAECPLGR